MADAGAARALRALAVPLERHAWAASQWWFEFHLNHEYYNIEFLGQNYFGPPSPKSYLPVMVLATVPTVTMLLFLVGAIERVRSWRCALRAAAMGAA